MHPPPVEGIHSAILAILLLVAAWGIAHLPPPK